MIAEVVFDANSLDLAGAYENLGFMYYTADDKENALLNLRKSMKIKTLYFSPDDPAVIAVQGIIDELG